MQITIKSRVLTNVYNMEINFSPKGHSKKTSNFSFKDNLKKPACASKQDGLVLTTLRYLKFSMKNLPPSHKKYHLFNEKNQLKKHQKEGMNYQWANNWAKKYIKK